MTLLYLVINIGKTTLVSITMLPQRRHPGHLHRRTKDLLLLPELETLLEIRKSEKKS